MARGARLCRALVEGHSATELRYELGLYAVALGDLVGGRIAFGRVAAEARARGDRVAGTVALRGLAYVQRLQGDLEGALASTDAARGLAEALGDKPHLVRALALYGAVLHDLGRRGEARAQFDTIRALGDDPLARRGLWEAEHLLDCGEIELARVRTVRNLERCAAREWPGHVAHCHAVLGTAAARSGRGEAGREHLAALQAWTERTGEVELVLRAHLLAAELGDERERAEGAEKALRLGYRPLAARLTR
jgi:hypothetical protein